MGTSPSYDLTVLKIAGVAGLTPTTLAAGDVITEVGNDTVQNVADLIARIGADAPGSQATLDGP